VWITELQLAPTLMSVKENISMIIYSIYKIVNTVNGKVYIGMTRKSGNKRFRDHLNHSKSKKNKLLIQRKLAEYGSNCFQFFIIFQTRDVDYAKKMESHFIVEYNSLVPKGYNIHTGGNYAREFRTSDKIKERMLNDNPGKTKEALIKKSSTIVAENVLTKEIIVVEDRKKFAEDKNIPYSSIGWAIQHNKTLQNGWHFSYVKKRTMGV
jgi:group I intron endonuclease